MRPGGSVHYKITLEGFGGVVASDWAMTLSMPAAPEPGSSDELDVVTLGRTQTAPLVPCAFALVPQRDGMPLETQLDLALEFLAPGVARACTAAYRARLVSSFDKEALAAAVRAFRAMSYAAGHDLGVRRMVYRVAQMPNWWRWWTMFPAVTVHADYADVQPVDTDFGKGWRLPIVLRVKGDDAMYGTLLVVEPKGVLCMTAGVVAFDGFQPDEPGRRVRVQIVGATPGS